MSQFVVVVSRCDRSGDRRDKFPLGDRFLQNRERLRFGSIVTKFRRVIRRDQDARCDNVDFFQLPKCFKSRQTLHMHIEQGEMDVFVRRPFERFLTRLRFNQPKKRFEDFTKRTAKGIVVVGD